MSPHDEMLCVLEEQNQVLDAALEAFWQSIAESCPHIKTGDFDSVANAQLRAVATEAVAAWIALNDPDGEYLP